MHPRPLMRHDKPMVGYTVMLAGYLLCGCRKIAEIAGAKNSFPQNHDVAPACSSLSEVLTPLVLRYLRLRFAFVHAISTWRFGSSIAAFGTLRCLQLETTTEVA